MRATRPGQGSGAASASIASARPKSARQALYGPPVQECFTVAVSSADVARFALRREGLERLEPVLRRQHALVAARLDREPFDQRQLAAAVDRALRGAHGDGAV